jgi:mannose-6-phosphate isomerase-like protein (cupin superfamily)|tara:strand:- start:1313 stop:1696 length:384 start_codon:yes stop_codon:yes gene_type:complete
MNLQTAGKVDKGWGFEIVFANNDKYCGKLLVFERAGAKTSLVFHRDKAKSWFINAGKFKITLIDVVSGEMKQIEVSEGQTADFGPLSPHQVEALVDGSMIFEVGTGDYVEDRFRLAPGDTQKIPSEQ